MLRSQLTDAMKTAMKAKEAGRLATIRMMLAALKDKDIEARGKGNPDGIAEADILAMLQTMIKQRRESITMFEQGHRPELAATEAAEIMVIEEFLPRQLNDAETTAAIAGVIAELSASSLKDMGKVMAALRERFAGQMDFGKASGIIKAQLSA